MNPENYLINFYNNIYIMILNIHDRVFIKGIFLLSFAIAILIYLKINNISYIDIMCPPGSKCSEDIN